MATVNDLRYFAVKLRIVMRQALKGMGARAFFSF